MPRLIDADTLVQMPWVLPNRMTRETALECFRNIVSEAPTIDAEPVRHGRWVKDDLYNTVCSVCGERIPYIEEYDTDDDCGGTYDVEIDETPRCPHCGAKMDGGAEDAQTD